ncbi:hypothetical protein [Treponema pedis]|uniref:Uncharacterized protein n=1 Tax=Treponema pedis TaxID=409322 RepID=A0A7S7AWX9_9SPIR|nr:hypothetical protein [Treponema pedis]QOW61026.1 hypothetical protein IFE08_00970 [Treponema pedis]
MKNTKLQKTKMIELGEIPTDWEVKKIFHLFDLYAADYEQTLPELEKEVSVLERKVEPRLQKMRLIW